ncbi:transcription factor SOX-4-like [Monomorium pharaonis]|uniref:transcription factor SOX-4-like n=1 Tax=Monomorium pharaonis TaxID=307658 RepID=UPI00102E1316|nr:transcription factor SOX-4-like [Monomorium pharaonis]
MAASSSWEAPAGSGGVAPKWLVTESRRVETPLAAPVRSCAVPFPPPTIAFRPATRPVGSLFAITKSNSLPCTTEGVRVRGSAALHTRLLEKCGESNESDKRLVIRTKGVTSQRYLLWRRRRQRHGGSDGGDGGGGSGGGGCGCGGSSDGDGDGDGVGGGGASRRK